MVGEALIRPSSKEANNLVLHWVVRLGVIKIITVIEEDKENDISIGGVLKIKNDKFGDIDELLALYIAPLNERVEEVKHHRKFLDRPKEQIDQQLRDQKKRQPAGTFYHLCWNDKWPSCVSLRFIMNTNVRSHLISLSVEGYVWGKKTYPEMDLLLNQFKRNPSGQPAGSARVSLPPVPKASRWDAGRATQPQPPATNGGWAAAPPSTSLPPPPNHPPMQPPGNPGWPPQPPGQRPPPPSFPPPPQHNFGNAPPPRPPPY